MESFEKIKPRNSRVARRGNFVIRDDGVKQKEIEIWEYETWKMSKGWGEKRWADIEGVAAATTISELSAPRGYAWSSDWQVMTPEKDNKSLPWHGFDKEGWEYATNEEKLGVRPPRKALALDNARRRRWTRLATKKQKDKGIVDNNSNIYQAIIKDLERVQRLRYKIEAKSRLAGTPLDSLEVRNEMNEFARQVQEIAAIITNRLDDIPPNRAAAVHKLRRDLSKEVTLIAGILRALPTFIESTAQSIHHEEKATTKRDQSDRTVTTGHGSLTRQQQLMLVAHEKTASASSSKKQEQNEDTHLFEGRVRTISENTVVTRIESETTAAVKDVHDSILAINALMKDLANQVEVQQVMIDSIEQNTTEAHVAVENAAEQLQEAVDIQNGNSGPCIIS